MPETLDCGCVRRPHPSLPRIRVLDACRLHGIQLHTFGFLHEFGGHEDCCDVPHVRSAMKRWGYTLPDLTEAAEAMDRDAEREYVVRLLAHPDLAEATS